MKAFHFLSLFIGTSVLLSAQKVTVGPEISIRNNLSYDIIGSVDDKILLYSDKGGERDLIIYNEELVLQSERQINLRDRKSLVYEVVNLDSLFGIFYGFRDGDEYVIAYDVFDSNAEIQDSLIVSRKERHWKGLDYNSIESEDGSKLGLYNIIDNEKLKLIVFDLRLKKTILDAEFKIINARLQEELEDMELANTGEFYVLAQSNNSRSTRRDHRINIYKFFPHSDFVVDVEIPLREIVCTQLNLEYNNRNSTLGIAGLYDEKRTDESTGLIWIIAAANQLENAELKLHPFQESLLFDIYGEKKSNRLEGFVVNDIFWRANGSPLLLLEMQTDYTRRATPTNYTGRGTYNDYASSYGGWSDHYREDIIVFSLNAKFESDWQQVFYKKQFSQNDRAIFSSYFPLVTPSRLRLIFNDEIRSNSTVSEYIFDGAGNYKRASVLSTEYQNLRLRFSDGLQISPSEILVPSEKNYSLSIVKIDFQEGGIRSK